MINLKKKILNSQDKRKLIDIIQAINLSKSKTFEIKNSIVNGIFGITTDEKNCRNCDMEAICRRRTVN